MDINVKQKVREAKYYFVQSEIFLLKLLLVFLNGEIVQTNFENIAVKDGALKGMSYLTGRQHYSEECAKGCDK